MNEPVHCCAPTPPRVPKRRSRRRSRNDLKRQRIRWRCDRRTAIGSAVAVRSERAAAGSKEEDLMAKRMILMLTVSAAVIAALGFVKFRQVKAAIAVYAAFQPPPEAVTTIVARTERWPSTLSAIGTVA